MSQFFLVARGKSNFAETARRMAAACRSALERVVDAILTREAQVKSSS